MFYDTVSPFSITPNQEDFEGPMTSSNFTLLNDLASQTPVMGIGLVKWVIRDLLGNVGSLKTQEYCFLSACLASLFQARGS